MTIELNFGIVYSYIAVCCVLGFFYGIYNCVKVMSIKTEGENLENIDDRIAISEEEIRVMNDIANKIKEVTIVS